MKKFLTMLVVAMMTVGFSSCGSKSSGMDPELEAALNQYIEMNNNSVMRNQILQSGYYSNYNCYRSGNDIRVDFVFADGISCPDDADLAANKSLALNPVKGDYATNPVAKKAIDGLASVNGSIIYSYKDSTGKKSSLTLTTDEIIN